LAAATVPASKGRVSKAPNGPFHTRVLVAASRFSNARHRLGPTSSTISSAAMGAGGDDAVGRVGAEFLRHTTSTGSSKRGAAFARPVDHLARGLQMVGLIQRLADGDALGARKVLAIAPPITSVSTRPTSSAAGRSWSKPSLRHYRQQRTLRIAQRLVEMGELGLHRAARRIGQQTGDAFRAGMARWAARKRR